MSIITISRGSYSHGKEVAEKVARQLGYTCVSREIILKASEHFNVPEIKLVRAIHDAPTILGRFTYGKERYVAYFREALLHYCKTDNVVYHGLAGHFFVQGIDHVLKVRVIAGIEDRLEEELKRTQNAILAGEARKLLVKDDEQRRRWSQYLYGIDTQDSSLYDMVLHIRPMSTDEAVRFICEAAQLPCFQATPESQKAIDKLFLAAQVQAALVEETPSVMVSVEGEDIVVNYKGYWAEKKMLATVDQIIDDNKDGVKVKVRLISP